MQAYVDGKEIQSYYADAWHDVTPTWAWNNNPGCYRIKSEPKYRPYANAEEMDKAIQEHGSWVKNKATGLRCQIAPYGLRSIDDYYYYDGMLKLFTWLDGTPCGVMEE